MNNGNAAPIDNADARQQNSDKIITLQTLDDKSIRLQKTGNYIEALEYMEKALILRQHLFGPKSDEFWIACKTTSEMYNLLAMGHLQQSNFPPALELLRKAELLTERDKKGRAVTLNNLACYYRRNGNLTQASRYLSEALRLEDQMIDQESSRADTHLNMCAVLSEMGKHQNALHHAQSALVLLHEELHLPGMDGVSTLSGGNGSNYDRVAVLGIAYHNAGVEQEFLKRFEASIQSYNKGLECTEQWLGTKHGIVLTLRRALDHAQHRLAASRKPIFPIIGSSKSRAHNTFASHQLRRPGSKRNALMVQKPRIR
uniref:Uncharacterized protein AlNc14C115G6519 n=1 Tax=Albugo laibachii Nc14 TaxID=890382 RepID=F0WIY3_9STRA|nr:conserved hypothetical protein [Albugo laibachii Nc14]|eukprot:CCA21229.1 conserved hypothetical protein [Albugo laibachii Nc14]